MKMSQVATHFVQSRQQGPNQRISISILSQRTNRDARQMPHLDSPDCLVVRREAAGGSNSRRGDKGGTRQKTNKGTPDSSMGHSGGQAQQVARKGKKRAENGRYVDCLLAKWLTNLRVMPHVSRHDTSSRFKRFQVNSSEINCSSMK